MGITSDETGSKSSSAVFWVNAVALGFTTLGSNHISIFNLGWDFSGLLDLWSPFSRWEAVDSNHLISLLWGLKQYNKYMIVTVVVIIWLVFLGILIEIEFLWELGNTVFSPFSMTVMFILFIDICFRYHLWSISKYCFHFEWFHYIMRWA